MQSVAQKSGRLAARTVAVTELGAADREGMWRVFSRYYADVRRDVFERDLDKKHHVVVLFDSGDRSLQGFSTLEVYAEAGARVIFTGDTIVEKDYWGQSALHRAFFAFLLRERLRRPWAPVYWFLISKGYKTYLTLARNLVNYWPRHDAATPAHVQGIIAALAERKYPGAYHDGVLRFASSAGRLKESIAPIDAAVLQQPDIRFFVEKNPGHARGDELCCLGRVDAAMVSHFVGKQIRRIWSGAADATRRFLTAPSS